jgi:D-methionine transport system substrate-binding protein
MKKQTLKKGLIAALVLVLALSLMTACGSKKADTPAAPANTGSAAATDTPAEKIVVNVACRNDYPEIWDAVNAELADDNIEVVNTAYDTSVNLNELLLAGDIDMNVAQHYAYLNLAKGSDPKFEALDAIGEIHIATLDLYSDKYTSVDEIPDGATIAIPNDPLNGGRAILGLEKTGLIKLDETYDIFPDETNIIENPKNIKFLEIASDSMVITLQDVDAGFVYSINAVDGNLDPTSDPIFKDKLDILNNPAQKNFVIIFTARSEDKDNATLQKIIDAYHTDSVYKVYKEVYKNSIIPVKEGVPVDLSKY